MEQTSRSRRRNPGLFTLGVLGIALWLGVPVALIAGSAVPPVLEEIRVFTKFGTQFAEGNVGPARFGPGDYVVFRDPVFAADKTTRLGSVHVQCTSMFRRDMCRGTIELPGRGTITFDGITVRVNRPHIRRFAITGGTEEFAAVRGEFVSDKALNQGGGLFFTIRLLKDAP